MDLKPGSIIAGRYRVDTKVGAGGMGEVWAGEHAGIGIRVAVKTLLPAAALNHEVVARFRREAFLLGRIRSDHVARVVDFIADDVYGLVLVMEFVEGEPLSRWLQEKTLSVEETIELGVDIASALKDLHGANIIHRDLKPGNIIMKPLPDGRKRAVVVDFGVSRMMSDKSKDEDEEITGITRADMAVGTIEYMAPEQILNSRNVTPGSDIYAAGAILFRAAAGRHIHGNVASDVELAQKKLTTESPPLPLTRNDKAAEGLARVVGKMCKRRPSERYKSADEVLADFVPVRDAARAATTELEAPTLDASKATPAVVAGAPAAAQPAQVAAAAPGAPTNADSSVSVSALQTAAKPEPPPKRGVSPLVTFGLVAAALGGGVFLGPRLLAPAVPAVAEQPPPAASASAAPAPPATASATAAVPASAEPAASASAAPTASASAVPSASATAAAATGSAAAKPAPGAPTAKPAASGTPTAAPKPADTLGI